MCQIANGLLNTSFLCTVIVSAVCLSIRGLTILCSYFDGFASQYAMVCSSVLCAGCGSLKPRSQFDARATHHVLHPSWAPPIICSAHHLLHPSYAPPIICSAHHMLHPLYAPPIICSTHLVLHMYIFVFVCNFYSRCYDAGQFTLRDMYEQFQNIMKMGPFNQIIVSFSDLW